MPFYIAGALIIHVAGVTRPVKKANTYFYVFVRWLLGEH
jgi:hypothetical protein